MRAWTFERGILWAIELNRAPATRVVPRLPASLGEARREVAGPLAQAMGLPDPDLVTRRLALGRRCFVAWKDGNLISYGWVSQVVECIGEHEREIHLGRDEAYIWDCATLPAYRGQRLYSALLGCMATRLYEDGVRRIWIGTALDNQPSLRGFANAGFRPVVTLASLRLFNLRCAWFGGHPTAPSYLVEAARRALRADHERAFGPFSVGRIGPARLPSCAQLEA